MQKNFGRGEMTHINREILLRNYVNFSSKDTSNNQIQWISSIGSQFIMIAFADGRRVRFRNNQELRPRFDKEMISICDDRDVNQMVMFWFILYVQKC